MSSDEFTLERTLGEGAFGKVYLVKDLANKQYAMKVIDLRNSPAEEKELAVREAELLKDLKHDNVLRYTDSFEKDGALCIVTEFCSNGDLSEHLEQRKGKQLEEDQLIDWFRQITCALQYLHRKKIIHRDVKTPNVFLSDKWEVKLGDMGLAKVLERPNAKAVTFCGSPYYMSPEIFSCKPYDSKSDIWALGVIVYEMATLERPFDAMLMHQLVFKIVHGGLPTMPSGYKDGLTDLLKMIMQKDPESRPTADAILAHDYFKGAKPVKPPKPVDGAGAAAEVSGKSKYGIVKPKPNKKGGHGAGGPFDTKMLLDTLSMKRQEKRAEADKARGAVGGSDTVKGIQSILATHVSPKKDKIVNKFKKDVTIRPQPSKESKSDTMVSVSDVNLDVTQSSQDFEETLKDIQSKVATDAFNVMQLIVRTMTGLFPRDDDSAKEALQNSLHTKTPSRLLSDYMEVQAGLQQYWSPLKRTMGSHDPKAVMLRQVEHLQFYCIKVLNNDMSLFQKAYDLLGTEKDECKLEEHLINVLGHEKFGLCGVQLMFLKNFEYNLSKF